MVEKEILTFKTPRNFETWLKKNHARSKGIWVRFLKKAHKESTGEKSVNYREALDVALCYGWIDSQANSLDDISYIQRFSPRGRKSMWSKINREHVARLIKEKRMTPAGHQAVAAAKKDGRWAGAYDGSATMKIPADFLLELSKDKKAKAFFDTLNRANVYAIGYRLQTAKKPETRAKRVAALLAMLRRGQKLH